MFAEAAAKIEKPDFKQHVKPILEAACVHCHNDKSDKGGLNVTTLELTVKGGDNGTALVPGDPAKSPLYTTTVLAADEDAVMPPKKEGLLAPEQAEILKLWVQQGANWPKEVKLEQTVRVNFEKHIQPILEENCLSCHNADKAKGDLNLATKKDASPPARMRRRSLLSTLPRAPCTPWPRCRRITMTSCRRPKVVALLKRSNSTCCAAGSTRGQYGQRA
ncbi:c-type cytochrome domain-containing protein [Verrucomicrobium spinosum]|uniref:c-type cytochrome domain-containing protein n=1 Tax=Verrucomicrobium spinosum TaxID=2736 RepID=UPI000AD38903|nr:c-type cytochrome domain-containing protein [Verrucomicrobium spinosum]